MDMPEKIDVTIREHNDGVGIKEYLSILPYRDSKTVSTEFIRADAGNVLPELPEGWAYSSLCWDDDNNVMVMIENTKDENYRDTVKRWAKTPRAAAEDAIAKIKRD